MQIINHSILFAAAAMTIIKDVTAACITPGVYTITSVGVGTRIDLLNGLSAAGTPVTGWQFTKGEKNPHQMWKIAETGDGFYTITNTGTGTVISADPNVQPIRGPPGNWLTGQPPSSSHAAHWAMDSGSKIIWNRQWPGSVIDLTRAESTNGIQLLSYPYHGGTNQQWTLDLVPS